MSRDAADLLAIGLYFVAMLAIGWYAYRRTSDLDDYMLAGRGLGPGVAAMSVGASDMSGWLLLGLPGAIYVSGLGEVWLVIGLTVGAWLNWKITAPRLRTYTEVAGNAITVPSYLENRFHARTPLLRITAGVIILVFFTFYVSSGVVAGGLLFETAFGMPYVSGLLLVAVITTAYTVMGGFLGVAWTDVAQGLLMLGALLVLPIVGVATVGGVDAVVDAINSADASAGTGIDRLSLVQGTTAVGIISSMAWGLGHFGQPHLIVRYMALRSAKQAVSSRRIHITWMLLTCGGAILVALVGVAYLPSELSNPESVLLEMNDVLFPPFVAGVVLAAVLAAVMSTISSQLLVCSSALVADLYKAVGSAASPGRRVLLGRAGVVAIAVIATLMALDSNSLVLDLVGFAWAGFGASFGPVLVLSLYWRKMTAAAALAGMTTGGAVAFVWGRFDLGANPIFDLYEIVPGFVAGAAVAIAVGLFTRRDNPQIEREFDDAVAMTRNGTAETGAATRAATGESRS